MSSPFVSPSFPPHLLIHVVTMIGSRTVRQLLGFPLDMCMRLRIPPCHLASPMLNEGHEALAAINRALHWRTRKPQELFVYDPARKLTVYMDYSRYHKYEFSVVTNITLIASKEKPEWIVMPGSQERTLWYNYGGVRRFQDETVGTFSYFSDTLPDIIVE